MKRRHISAHLLAVVAAATALAIVAAAAVEPLTTENLRCLRPFSAMETFADAAKSVKDQNCDFHFFSATTASVSLDCEGTSSPAHEVEGCNVTMKVDMQVPADVADRLAKRTGDTGAAAGGLLLDQDDLWRYEFQMVAMGDGTAVTYKGFSGEGYSLCCDGMTTAEDNCAWMTQAAGDNDLAEEDADGVEEEAQRQRRLFACALPLPRTARRNAVRRGGGGGGGGGSGGASGASTFQVRVTKPLPDVIAGAWEARLQFSRKRAEGDREDLGRVIVAFAVQPDELWAGGHVREASAGSGGRGDTAADAVVAVAAEEQADADL